jgi:TusA-related sulfurtransferase
MSDAAGKVHVLDVSGLEPPQPMVAILEKIQELGPGDVLEVSHHREPVPLYALLEEAGFTHEIEKLGENSYRLKIRRKDG